jgi:hypothetical protein
MSDVGEAPTVEDALSRPWPAARSSMSTILDDRPSRAAEELLRLGSGLYALLSIYTGFTSRALVDRVKEKTGKYFYVGAPDNYTGIANAYWGRNIGRFERGLSLGGNSGASTGCAYFFRSKGAQRREAYHAEERKSIAEIINRAWIPSVNRVENWADIQLRAKGGSLSRGRTLYGPHGEDVGRHGRQYQSRSGQL